MPDFVASKPDTILRTGPGGSVPFDWLMLGAAGYNTVGIGRWIELEGATWKSFLLRAAASPYNTALGALAVVQIQAANALDPVDPEANTRHTILASLTTAAPSYSTEVPWRFIRAQITVVGDALMQVDFHGIHS